MAGKASDVSRDLDAPIQPGEFTDEISPESAEKFFKAVVLEAFKDATGDLPDEGTGSMPKGWAIPARSKHKSKTAAWLIHSKGKQVRRREAEDDRATARNWLLNGGRDFSVICTYAGWDPEYIRRGARKLDALGWPNMAPEMMAKAAA